MATKLTLSMDEQVIRKAKKYAQATGNSLSQMVEHYLDGLAAPKSEERISNKLKGLLGAVKLKKGFKEERVLRSYLTDKYK